MSSKGTSAMGEESGEKSALVPLRRFPEFCGTPAWNTKTLDQVSPSIFDGTHQTPKYAEEGVPFFSVENIVSGNRNKFISEEDHIAATRKNKPEQGDILVTRIGNIGHSVVVHWDYEFSIYVTLAVVKSSPSFDSYFLHGYFQSSRYQKEILSKSLLNAVPCKINMEELRKTEVLLPEIAEQKKIADCLSSLDELITAEIQKLDALKTHKKGLMQQLFPREGETVPRMRFPEFRDMPEWAEKNLGEICKIQRGKFSHRPRNDPRFFGGKYPFIQTGDVVKSNGGSVQASQTLNELGLGVSKLFKPPIVLITIAANIGDTGLLEREACFTDSVAGLIPNRGVSAAFLELAVRGKKEHLNKIAPAAAQKNINNEILSTLPVLMPSFDEQQRIASCLSSLDDLITTQTQKIDALKTHKKGLMQQLFPLLKEEPPA